MLWLATPRSPICVPLNPLLSYPWTSDLCLRSLTFWGSFHCLLKPTFAFDSQFCPAPSFWLAPQFGIQPVSASWTLSCAAASLGPLWYPCPYQGRKIRTLSFIHTHAHSGGWAELLDTVSGPGKHLFSNPGHYYLCHSWMLASEHIDFSQGLKRKHV